MKTLQLTVAEVYRRHQQRIAAIEERAQQRRRQNTSEASGLTLDAHADSWEDKTSYGVTHISGSNQVHMGDVHNHHHRQGTHDNSYRAVVTAGITAGIAAGSTGALMTQILSFVRKILTEETRSHSPKSGSSGADSWLAGSHSNEAAADAYESTLCNPGEKEFARNVACQICAARGEIWREQYVLSSSRVGAVQGNSPPDRLATIIRVSHYRVGDKPSAALVQLHKMLKSDPSSAPPIPESNHVSSESSDTKLNMIRDLFNSGRCAVVFSRLSTPGVHLKELAFSTHITAICLDDFYFTRKWGDQQVLILFEKPVFVNSGHDYFLSRNFCERVMQSIPSIETTPEIFGPLADTSWGDFFVEVEETEEEAAFPLRNQTPRSDCRTHVRSWHRSTAVRVEHSAIAAMQKVGAIRSTDSP